MEPEPITTYYPEDTIRLTVEIEHLPNFRRLEAVFRSRSGREVVVPHRASFYTDNIYVRAASPEGLKTSDVLFEAVARRDKFIPEAVYELAELRGETVGDLPDEPRRGNIVEFDLSDVAKPRFRYKEEAGRLMAKVRSVQLVRLD